MFTDADQGDAESVCRLHSWRQELIFRGARLLVDGAPYR